MDTIYVQHMDQVDFDRMYDELVAHFGGSMASINYLDEHGDAYLDVMHDIDDDHEYRSIVIKYTELEPQSADDYSINYTTHGTHTASHQSCDDSYDDSDELGYDDYCGDGMTYGDVGFLP